MTATASAGRVDSDFEEGYAEDSYARHGANGREFL